MSYGFGRINDLADRCHQNSKLHGFWEGADEHMTAVKLALVHSEVSEALEAHRKNDYDNFAEELADICIRVFDLAAFHHINLEQAIVDKMRVNEDRPYKHGKEY